ncbi:MULTISPECIES: flagellar basal body-associated protein FliL [Shewanella]|uniref:Flagellar protein FliL n=2 Tax=Shewanella decolorationis TaxID=256839 RepID=A0A5B8QWF8_9GAMM|nr:MULTISPECIES: flagellar basal body-associated protein FliL [Shewanella]ESE41217.1 flagellar basal body-associated protein [Shewanella decolorationis S12]MDH1625510.1 flagellar basal body-associated protein FliL [Shewanella xiamenensis]MDV5245546.1 flagellar basal body-associated protein FliL [Shewanella xiamenensis]QDZ90358.1 flagellar basal body-associated protein FliL [Shewanella decolorationis]GLR31637.1 flagellar basal body-associated protein FliL [Shewanella decolorationis]
MAKEESLELESTEAPKSKKKLFIFIGVGVLAALLIGGALWFFLGSSDEVPADAEGAKTEAEAPAAEPAMAAYVPMPRPFLFNLPGPDRSRLVEIKVQLMVRGQDDDVLTQKHIPLIEDALLTTFSGADVQKLSTQAGKDELRQLALLSVQNTLQSVTGRKVVEKVLFTGFVMQ